MNDVTSYIVAAGLPDEAIDTYNDILQSLRLEREADIREGRPAVPQTAMIGIALSRLETVLAQN